MAFQRIEMAFAMALIAMLCIGSTAQTTSGCTSVLISLSPCLNYLSGNSSTPSSGCCSQLANVVRSQPQCLCEALNSDGSSGLNIDRSRAVALPTACNVQTPPLSRCNNAGSPSNSPTGAPETPSDSGSKTIPSTDGGSSDATSSKIAMSLLFAALFIAYSG